MSGAWTMTLTAFSSTPVPVPCPHATITVNTKAQANLAPVEGEIRVLVRFIIVSSIYS
jgi:hypothetical protein